jgi:hypothetical protein
VIIPIESAKWRVKINIAARANDMESSGVIKGATDIHSQPASILEQSRAELIRSRKASGPSDNEDI